MGRLGSSLTPMSMALCIGVLAGCGGSTDSTARATSVAPSTRT
jgi:hypothetical protein